MTKYTLHKQNIPCERCGERDIRLYREYSTWNFSSVCMDCLEASGECVRSEMLDQESSNWWTPMIPGEPDNNATAWGRGCVPDGPILHFYSLRDSKSEPFGQTLTGLFNKIADFKSDIVKWHMYAKQDKPAADQFMGFAAERQAALSEFESHLLNKLQSLRLEE